MEFVFLMLCRCLILFLSFFDNQILDVDREGLTKLKKAVKAMHASGNGKKRNFLENILHNNFFLEGPGRRRIYSDKTDGVALHSSFPIKM